MFLLLSSAEKLFCSKVLSTIQNGGTQVAVPFNITMSKASSLIKIVLAENSEFFYYNNCEFEIFGGLTGKTIRLKMCSFESSLRLETERFRRESNRILDGIMRKGMNEKQIILAIYNYLTENIRYPQEAFSSGLQLKYHTAYGAIVDKCAVCEGIAAAFCYLLRLAGIRSSVICGKTNRAGHYEHSWNIVECGGSYYHFDITWDLKSEQESSGLPHFDYFGLTDDELCSRTWDNSLYPGCSSRDMDFFARTNSIAQSDAQFIEIAQRQLRANRYIYIKCPYLSRIQSDEQLYSYITSLFQTSNAVMSLFSGTVSFRFNAERSIVCTFSKEATR